MNDAQALNQVLRELDLRKVFALVKASELPHELDRHRGATPIAELLHCEACSKVSAEFCDFIHQASFTPTKE